MRDEIKTKVEYIRPLTNLLMTIGELPTSYLMSLTYEEQLLWFYNFLNEKIIPVINTSSKAVQELQELFILLQNYVNDYFDNLDLQEEVNNKIDAMIEDGSLQNIISDILNATNGTLICNIVYRDCTDYINGVTVESEQSPDKGWLQGMITTPSSIIYALQPGGAYDRQLNNAYLIEVSKSTGNVLKEAYLPIYHANSLAYNDTLKEIYVAYEHEITENGNVANNKIGVIDYNTFTIKDEITLPNDVLDNLDNDHIMSVSYDNKNNVLGVGSNNKFFILSDWETVENTITIDYSHTAPLTNPLFNSFTNQGIILFDNKLYQTRYHSNGINIYDLNGKLIKNYYNFDIDIPLELGELEAISLEENGDIYIASIQTTYSNNNNFITFDRTIFKSNLKYNGFKNFFYSTTLTNRVAFTVDCESTNHIQAGTSVYPFKSIQQAIMATEFTGKNVSCSINLVGTNKQYSFIIGKNNISIVLNGNNNLIYGMQLQNQTIEINNLKVNNDILINVATENNPSNVQITDNSNVIFNNVQILNNSNEQLTNGVYCLFSNLICYGVTIKNFINAFTILNSSSLKVNNLTITDCTYYWYNTSNCEILQGNSPAVIERQNPNSIALSYYKSYQRVPFTFDNNIITLNNISYDNNALFIFGVRFTYGSLAQVNELIVRADSNNIGSFNVITTNEIFHVYVSFSHQSQGVWRLNTIKVIQESLSDGTLTDVTNNSTINLRDVKIL